MPLSQLPVTGASEDIRVALFLISIFGAGGVITLFAKKLYLSSQIEQFVFSQNILPLAESVLASAHTFIFDGLKNGFYSYALLTASEELNKFKSLTRRHQPDYQKIEEQAKKLSQTLSNQALENHFKESVEFQEAKEKLFELNLSIQSAEEFCNVGEGKIAYQASV